MSTKISLTSSFNIYNIYNTMAGILAKKIEMTRVIKDNKFVPITILEVPALKVVGHKTLERDGYSAVVIGIVHTKETVQLKEGKKGLNPRDFSDVVEFRVEESEVEGFVIGSDVTLDALEGIELVSITGVSKGKGFAGAMKRHNFSGGPKTHGSKFHRALGSIGNRKPTRTHKGKKMHGHMGCDTVTLKKVPVELVNKEAKLLGLRGPIPGARNSLVQIIF